MGPSHQAGMQAHASAELSSLLRCTGDIDVSGAREAEPARAARRRPRPPAAILAGALRLPIGLPRSSRSLTALLADRQNWSSDLHDGHRAVHVLVSIQARRRQGAAEESAYHHEELLVMLWRSPFHAAHHLFKQVCVLLLACLARLDVC